MTSNEPTDRTAATHGESGDGGASRLSLEDIVSACLDPLEHASALKVIRDAYKSKAAQELPASLERADAAIKNVLESDVHLPNGTRVALTANQASLNLVAEDILRAVAAGKHANKKDLVGLFSEKLRLRIEKHQMIGSNEKELTEVAALEKFRLLIELCDLLEPGQ